MIRSIVAVVLAFTLALGCPTVQASQTAESSIATTQGPGGKRKGDDKEGKKGKRGKKKHGKKHGKKKKHGKRGKKKRGHKGQRGQGPKRQRGGRGR